MSIILKDQNTVSALTDVINELVTDADYSRYKLHQLRSLSPEHPDIQAYERFAGAYFALAAETHAMSMRLSELEGKNFPPTLLELVSTDMRLELTKLAHKHDYPLTDETLASIPPFERDVLALNNDKP